MRILVTGFNPFGRHAGNPTRELAQEADGRQVGEARLAGRVLPTDFAACDRALASALRKTRPDAVLMFGLWPKAKRIALECVALNVDHSVKADNAGQKPWRRVIDARGPVLLESTASIDRLHAAMKRARIPVAVSYHAGTFVCNHAYYRALRIAGRRPVAFVHVPKKIAPGRLERALEVLVRAVAEGNSPRERRVRKNKGENP